MTERDDFWEQPEQVAAFADREPDQRLQALVANHDDPCAIRVLDIACAGGRNTEFLAQRGFDVHAIDAAHAMIRHTRQRLRAHYPRAAIEQRVRRGRMEDLSAFPDAHFELILALGAYHCAGSRAAFDSALRETARVATAGGRVLVSNFTPRCQFADGRPRGVPGEPHVYERSDKRRMLLFEAGDLDAEFARFGFVPAVPSETVVRQGTHGMRVTVNALYDRIGRGA